MVTETDQPFNGKHLVNRMVVNLLCALNQQRAQYAVLPWVVEFRMAFYDTPVYLVGIDGLSVNVILVDRICREKKEAYGKEEQLLYPIFLQKLYNGGKHTCVVFQFSGLGSRPFQEHLR